MPEVMDNVQKRIDALFSPIMQSDRVPTGDINRIAERNLMAIVLPQVNNTEDETPVKAEGQLSER